jgi:hypothetical protein
VSPVVNSMLKEWRNATFFIDFSGWSGKDIKVVDIA